LKIGNSTNNAASSALYSFIKIPLKDTNSTCYWMNLLLSQFLINLTWVRMFQVILVEGVVVEIDVNDICHWVLYSSASEFVPVPFSYRTVSYRTVFRFPLYRKFFKIVYRTVFFSHFIAKAANRAVRKGNYLTFFY